MSDYLRIRNLEKYQHYKDRRPTWVKLYQDVLEDLAFTRLQDASKAHAMLLILIASRYDNKFPNDAQWLARAVHATEPVDVEALLSAGWLETWDASKVASKGVQKRKRSAMPKRTEKRDSRRGAKRTPKEVQEATDTPPLPAVAGESPADAEPTFKNWPADYGSAWEQARRGTAPFGRIGRALGRLIDRDGPAAHYPAWLRFVASDKAAYGPEYFANNLIEFTASPREREQIQHEGEAFDMLEWQIQQLEVANRDRARFGSPPRTWEEVYPDQPRPAKLRAHAA